MARTLFMFAAAVFSWEAPERLYNVKSQDVGEAITWKEVGRKKVRADHFLGPCAEALVLANAR